MDEILQLHRQAEASNLLTTLRRILDDDLDTTVLLTSRSGVVICNWPVHTHTYCREPLRSDPLLRQVIPDRISTALGQALVVFGTTDIIGMTLNLNTTLGILVQEAHQTSC